MEACASADYWARELKKIGHDVRLMPAKDVKAYVKRNKNDSVDAAACCEAVRRPTVRTVPVKTREQQAQLMQHRVRDLLVRQRTQAVNALRSHLAELGIVAAQGYDGVKALLSVVADTSDARLPENARASLSALVAQISCCQAQIAAIDKRLLVQHRKSDNCKRLETIPGIGVLGASAIVATVPDVAVFKTGRHFAAWIGIVSRKADFCGAGHMAGSPNRTARPFRITSYSPCKERYPLKSICRISPSLNPLSGRCRSDRLCTVDLFAGQHRPGDARHLVSNCDCSNLRRIRRRARRLARAAGSGMTTPCLLGSRLSPTTRNVRASSRARRRRARGFKKIPPVGVSRRAGSRSAGSRHQKQPTLGFSKDGCKALGSCRVGG